MEAAGGGGLKEAEFFKLGDNIVNTFALGAGKNCVKLFFYHIIFFVIAKVTLLGEMFFRIKETLLHKLHNFSKFVKKLTVLVRLRHESFSAAERH